MYGPANFLFERVKERGGVGVCVCVWKTVFNFLKEKGASADAQLPLPEIVRSSYYTCSNRRGQPKRSAMQGPHSGRNPSLIRLYFPVR